MFLFFPHHFITLQKQIRAGRAGFTCISSETISQVTRIRHKMPDDIKKISKQYQVKDI